MSFPFHLLIHLFNPHAFYASFERLPFARTDCVVFPTGTKVVFPDGTTLDVQAGTDFEVFPDGAKVVFPDGATLDVRAMFSLGLIARRPKEERTIRFNQEGFAPRAKEEPTSGPAVAIVLLALVMVFWVPALLWMMFGRSTKNDKEPDEQTVVLWIKCEGGIVERDDQKPDKPVVID
jgi:hypothetical protein